MRLDDRVAEGVRVAASDWESSTEVVAHAGACLSRLGLERLVSVWALFDSDELQVASQQCWTSCLTPSMASLSLTMALTLC